MAASGQRLWRGGEAPVSPAANHAGDEAPTPPGAPAIPAFELKAPWHVRHARRLYAMIGLVCVAGVAAAGYHAWWLFFNPLDRALAIPVKALPIRAAERAPDPAPAAKRPPAAPAKPAAAPRPAAVTHTLAEQATVAPPVPPPVPHETRTEAPRCSEGVLALGLCGAAGTKGGR